MNRRMFRSKDSFGLKRILARPRMRAVGGGLDLDEVTLGKLYGPAFHVSAAQEWFQKRRRRIVFSDEPVARGAIHDEGFI